MNASTKLFQTWHTDRVAEGAMDNSHVPMWRRLIPLVPETDLSTLAMRDFGGNQGGFLRLLYALRPFHYGAGVDIAQASIDLAIEPNRDLPIEFAATASLKRRYRRIDRAFSYAVTGCHTANPLWPAWRTLIAAHSNATAQDYAPEDCTAAFAAAGFDVSFK